MGSRKDMEHVKSRNRLEKEDLENLRNGKREGEREVGRERGKLIQGIWSNREGVGNREKV